jgi:hypothetical protein
VKALPLQEGLFVALLFTLNRMEEWAGKNGEHHVNKWVMAVPKFSPNLACLKRAKKIRNNSVCIPTCIMRSKICLEWNGSSYRM